jgi:RNA polymerase sigma factor (TIGR02999 family)
MEVNSLTGHEITCSGFDQVAETSSVFMGLIYVWNWGMVATICESLSADWGQNLPDTTSNQVTELLRRWREGDQAALDALVPLVYDELRRVAHNYLQRERLDHTLQSTAVVHEAYLRLVEGAVAFQNREHFFAVAAQLMRQILVDYARRHRSLKRDGGYKLALDEALKLPSKDVDLVDLDDALKELARMDARQGRIVELRFFGGLSIEETAEALSLSAATVERSWASARAWLYRQLSRNASS